MAGEWIKVQGTTPDKPEILKMARKLGIDRDAVLGKLVRVWAWFDSNSVDGVVDGAVADDIDVMVSLDGFSSVMVDVGWLISDDENEKLTLPNFEHHNGETAKTRALKNKRQARWRQKPVDAPPSTNASTREEKRREDISKGFKPPTQAEVFKAMKEKGVQNAQRESEKFVNFYESKGWMIGKNKMKSWPHAVGNWCADMPKSDVSFGSDAI